MGEIKLLNDVRGVVGCSLREGCSYVVCSQIATKTSVCICPYGGLIIRWQKPSLITCGFRRRSSARAESGC